MLELFMAEWNKITGHRWNAAFFVWIFPLGAVVIGGAAMLIALLSEDYRNAQMALGIAPWDDSLLYGWSLVNSELGRFVAVAFAATVFAREYAHGTWKNLVTRRARITIVTMKFITMAVMLALSFVLMTLILGVFSGLVAGYLGLDFGTVTGPRLTTFLGDYAQQTFLTLMAVLIAAGYAALASMITRSVMTASVTGVLFTILEQGILLPIGIARGLLNIDLRGLYFLTPSYNLGNISSYFNTGNGFTPFATEPGRIEPHSMELSLLIVAVWLFGLIGLAIWRFQRQDITV